MFVLSQGVYIHGTISLSWYAQLVKGWFAWNASPNTMKTTATFVMSWITLSSHNKYKSCLNVIGVSQRGLFNSASGIAYSGCM